LSRPPAGIWAPGDRRRSRGQDGSGAWAEPAAVLGGSLVFPGGSFRWYTGAGQAPDLNPRSKQGRS
jgi:hypothetical protein